MTAPAAATAKRPILFSGAQPTGEGLTLGNLLGAVQNWVRLQASHDCLFTIVDLHAITMRQDPLVLRETTYRVLANYLAAGIDPKKSVVFAQSHAPQHAELAWILVCHAYMGELSRMTQFKDKGQGKDGAKGQNVGAGLFVYPALMAADILLYQAQLVPVGQDQKQHLELARDLAVRMNNQVREGLFQVPEIYIPPIGAKIMSLHDPAAKMSKSDANESATVFLADSDEAIVKKFKRAVTDSIGVIKWSAEQPGVKNLISIEAAITGIAPEALEAEMSGKQYGYLKGRVADVVIAYLKPMRDEQNRLLADRSYLDAVLRTGGAQARTRAEQTLRATQDALGFVARD